MKKAARITGTMGVLVGKYSMFDPTHPEKTQLTELNLVNLDGGGKVGSYWANEGYIQVGTAKVEIELMQRDEINNGAVVALRKQKAAVLAKAQNEATEIEQRIQSLLAITNEA